MSRKSLHQLVAVLLVTISLFVTFGQGYAAPTLKLTVNPNQTEFPTGHAPVSLAARASGANLEYSWKVDGPGKIEGSGPAVLYEIPESLDSDAVAVTITVSVKDDSGEEATESVTLTIVQAQESGGAVPEEEKEGMSTGTKVALGVGGAALAGGVIALAAGGSSDDGDSSDDVDFNGPWKFNGQLTQNDCDLNVVPSIEGDITFYQAGTRIETNRVNLRVIQGGGYWYFTYIGTASGDDVSLAAVDPYVFTGGGAVYHFGSGIEAQNVKNNSGNGSLNLTGQCIQGCSGSCQTIWSGTWVKQ